VMKKKMELWGLSVVQCETQEEAADSLEKDKSVSAVIVDIQQDQSISDKLKTVPIIALSFHQMHSSLDVPHLKKPIKDSALRECLIRLIPFSRQRTPKAVTKRLSADFPVNYSAPILIAEDNPMNQQVIRKLLNKIGFTDVDVVENGLESLKAVQQKTYRIVLMDVMMPVMGGIEATERIRKLDKPRKEQPYIIALTADAFQENAKNCYAAGMDAVITKPIQRPDLDVVISFAR